jgi:hypothetical protein
MKRHAFGIPNCMAFFYERIPAHPVNFVSSHVVNSYMMY